MPDETFYESLKCILTDREKLDIANQFSQAEKRITEAKNELSSVKAKINGRIKTDEEIISSCSEKLRSGYEFRRVECEEVKDYERDEVNVIRLDNYGFVRTRKMEPGERQKNLPLKEETKGDNGGQPVEVMRRYNALHADTI